MPTPPPPTNRVLHGAWDIYSRGNDASPELIAFDFDAAQRDLSEELPYCAVVKIQIKSPGPRGEPVGPEAELLYDMQDALVSRLEQHATRCRLVARVTYDGIRELVFGLSDWDEFRPPVGQWMYENSDYDVDVAEYSDWDFYNQYIRPTAEILEYVEDRRTIAELVRKGIDPSEDRVMDFYFNGPHDGVTEAARVLGERQYTTDGVSSGAEADAGEASLVAHRRMPLDALHDEAAHHRALAEQQGITYDGWGTSLVGVTTETE